MEEYVDNIIAGIILCGAVILFMTAIYYGTKEK